MWIVELLQDQTIFQSEICNKIFAITQDNFAIQPCLLLILSGECSAISLPTLASAGKVNEQDRQGWYRQSCLRDREDLVANISDGKVWVLQKLHYPQSLESGRRA